MPLISHPIAMEGEVEITATSKVLKKSINVSNTHRDTVFVYREDVFPNETPILVQYTPIRVPILVQYTPIRVPILVQYTPIRVPILVQYTPIRVPILVQYTPIRVPILVQYTQTLVPILVQYTPIRVPILVQYTPIRQDVGHYEFIVTKSPSHRDGGKLESVPAPPPHSKVCLHRILTAKGACTAPSQQSVPAPPPHSKVCLHRLLTAKCACSAPSQQHPSHSRGRLVRCLNSPLRSKKQGLRKERESPAPAN